MLRQKVSRIMILVIFSNISIAKITSVNIQQAKPIFFFKLTKWLQLKIDNLF